MSNKKQNNVRILNKKKKDTIHQYTTLHYRKFQIATCFDCKRQPTSDLCFRNVKSKLYSYIRRIATGT